MLIPSLYNRVYFDPDFDDCKALGDDRWDTLRLITVQRGNDPELLVAASGYGHTHTTVVDNLRTLPGYTRQSAWSTDSFILYYEAGAYYMDMDGKTNRKDDDRVPAVPEVFAILPRQHRYATA